MIRIFVAAIALGLAGGGNASAQQGASDVVVQPPDRATVFPERKPRADLKGFAMMMVDYPPRALRRREEGDVTLSFCVDAKGLASDFKLVKSSGSEVLDEATLKGMQRLKYEPGLGADGKPTNWCDPPYVLTVAWRLPPS